LVHMKVYDAANQLLGEASSFWALGVTVKTSAGFLIDITWDGAFSDGDLAYDMPGCASGNRWLASPAANMYTLSNILVWEASTNSLFKLEDNDTAGDGMAKSVTFPAASFWSWGTCYETPSTAAG